MPIELIKKNGSIQLTTPKGESDSVNIDLGITGAIVGQTIKVAEVDGNGAPIAWESVDFPESNIIPPVSDDEEMGVANEEWKIQQYDFSNESAVSIKLELPSENIKEFLLVMKVRNTGTTSNGKSNWRLYADIEATSGNPDKLYSLTGNNIYTSERTGYIHYRVLNNSIAKCETVDFSSSLYTNTTFPTYLAKNYLYFVAITSGAELTGTATLHYRE